MHHTPDPLQTPGAHLRVEKHNASDTARVGGSHPIRNNGERKMTENSTSCPPSY